jgi:molybdenum cofactor cytidylyltransferase
VVVSGSADLRDVVPEDVTLLVNEDWQEGQAVSLRVGIDWCARMGHEAAVVGLGDQPLVGAECWRRVAEAVGTPISVATYHGQRRNPVRLDRSVWHLLDVTGDEGARHLMRRRPDLVGEVACEGDPADLDRVEDLERWS